MPIFDRQGRRLVTAGQAAALLGVAPNAVAERRRTGTFPAPSDWVDGRTPVWRESDLELSDAVPAELRKLTRWITARRGAKLPDADRWLTYAEARDRAKSVSFILDSDGIACVQVARCLRSDGSLRDIPAAELLTWWAERTYTEISLAGDGLSIWGCAAVTGTRPVERAGVRLDIQGGPAAVRVTGERFADSPGWLAELSDLIRAT